MASGIKIEEESVGSGAIAERGSTVTIHWRGTLRRGEEFGSGEVTFQIGKRRVIAGLEKGVIGMRVGGERRLRISPHLAYRDKTVPGVPANALLIMEVKLLAVADAPGAEAPGSPIST